ncbi:MAG: hypothetical protein Q7S61_01565 [bacterium]|nr:hypothetical protein [bacterium]
MGATNPDRLPGRLPNVDPKVAVTAVSLASAGVYLFVRSLGAGQEGLPQAHEIPANPNRPPAGIINPPSTQTPEVHIAPSATFTPLPPTETATPFPTSLFHPDRAVIAQTKDYKVDYSLSGYDINQTTAGFKSVLEATGKIESTDAITIYAGQFRVNDQKGQDEVRDIVESLEDLQKATGQKTDSYSYRLQTTRAADGLEQTNIIATLADGSTYEATSYINEKGEKINTWRTEVVDGKTTIFDPESGKFVDATYGEGGVMVQVTKEPEIITATSTPVPTLPEVPGTQVVQESHVGLEQAFKALPEADKFSVVGAKQTENGKTAVEVSAGKETLHGIPLEIPGSGTLTILSTKQVSEAREKEFGFGQVDKSIVIDLSKGVKNIESIWTIRHAIQEFALQGKKFTSEKELISALEQYAKAHPPGQVYENKINSIVIDTIQGSEGLIPVKWEQGDQSLGGTSIQRLSSSSTADGTSSQAGEAVRIAGMGTPFLTNDQTKKFKEGKPEGIEWINPEIVFAARVSDQFAQWTQMLLVQDGLDQIIPKDVARGNLGNSQLLQYMYGKGYFGVPSRGGIIITGSSQYGITPLSSDEASALTAYFQGTSGNYPTEAVQHRFRNISTFATNAYLQPIFLR